MQGGVKVGGRTRSLFFLFTKAREDHAVRALSGSFQRSDAAQKGANAAVFGRKLKRRPSPTRAIELNHQKQKSNPAQPSSRAQVVPDIFCVHVRFRFHEQSTNLQVTVCRRPMERRNFTTKAK
jgi:hypothetical protein